MGRYFRTNSEAGEALEQDLEQCLSSTPKAILKAWLGHITASQQVCGPHWCTRKIYTPEFGGRVFVSSAACTRQRLHSDFRKRTVEQIG